MKAPTPVTKFSTWQSEQLFHIDFASYTLTHHSFPRHFHDHYVIELVVNGIDSYYCAGKNYQAEKNQLVLINPGEVHTGSTMSDIPLQYYSLYPDKNSLEQVAESLGIALPRDFTFQQSLRGQSSFTRKLRLLFDSFFSNKDSLKQEELFFDCMSDLLQPTGGPGSSFLPVHPKDARIQWLTDYIRSHFREDISLHQLACLVCLNPFHLVRLFKKATGITPYDYLLIIRAEHAKQLLRRGFRVQDAAHECGFYDSSHFNRLFSKIAGTSPKSFRSSKSQYCTILTA